MDFTNYTKAFMSNVYSYFKATKKMQLWNESSEIVKKMIEKLKEEYNCDENFEKVTVEQFLESDWVRFQVILSKYYSEHFYGPDRAMEFIEYVSMRDMLESVMMEQSSDQSVYTRIVNKLGIPLDQIPKQYIQILYISDEFMYATNYILKVIHEEFENPVKAFTLDEYRAQSAVKIEKAIGFLNEKGYFGTYDKDFLVELAIAYRVGYPMIGPLYITSKFPKNPNSYEDLKKYVERIWEEFKMSEQNGDDVK